MCHEYAKQHDTVILDAYIDRAMTGTNDNRPAFQKMIRDSEKQHWDYVIVKKMNLISIEITIKMLRLYAHNVSYSAAVSFIFAISPSTTV